MSDRNQAEPAGNGEDTDELLLSDLDEEGRSSGAAPPQPPKDHCDLLLDAIDAQLSRLQAQSHAPRARGDDGTCRRTDHTIAALLSRSQSPSKDTGLGSTGPTNDTLISRHEMVHSETQDLSSEKRSGYGGTTEGHKGEEEEEEEEKTSPEEALTGENKEGEESKQEQCRWRLQRLLGMTEEGFEGSLPHTADSVCTEDFATRFREEMVDPLVRLGQAEDESGSRTSGAEVPLETERESHSSEGVGRTDTSEGQGTQQDSGTGRHAFEDIVDGVKGCHLGSHSALFHNRDTLQSLEVLNTRVGRSQSVGRLDSLAEWNKGLRGTGSNGERWSMGGGACQGLYEQGRAAGSVHYKVITRAGHAQHSGVTKLDQIEVSRVQSQQECENPNIKVDPILTQGGSDSVTDSRNSPLLCIHKRPGDLPLRRGMDQTNTPCTGVSEEVIVPTWKRGWDVSGKQGPGSETRVLTRSMSCPTATAEARNYFNNTLHTHDQFAPIPTPVQLSPSPLKDTETSHSPSPSGAKPEMGQRRSPKGDRTCPHGQSWAQSTIPDCSSVGLSDLLNRSTPRPPSSSGTGVLTVSRCSMNTTEVEDDRGCTVHSAVRHLAGVPVRSFDTVTIDSDLDSVGTDRVRKHFQDALCRRAVARSDRGLHVDDLCSDQSDPDTPVLEPRSTLNLQVCGGDVSSRGRPVRKPHHTRRVAPGFVAGYVCSDDEETDEVEEEEKEQAIQRVLPELIPRGLVQWKCAPRRRRSSQGRGAHLRTLTGGWLGEMDSDHLLMEEALSSLRQDCLREEERLIQKRAQLCDTELSLTTLLQQKKHAMQELERVRAAVEHAEREEQGLEASVRDGRAQADNTRSQLRMLQSQRDSCLKEMSDLEEELTVLRRHRAVLQERTGAECERRQYSSSLSVLEREELDRQLDSAKTELFAEQRRARHKLDSLQEKLEETQQELDQRMEEARVLRERCTGLEEQLTHAQRQREELEQRRREEVEEMEALKVQVQELQGKFEEQGSRAGSLEHILAQKELQLLAAQEQRTCMQEERERMEAELHSLKEEHCAELKEAQEQAQRDKELELQQLRSELRAAAEQEAEQIHRRAEEEQQEALRHQALCHIQQCDTLQMAIQMKEGELRTLKEALDQQGESMKKQALELQAEAQEMAHQAVERELRRWELEREEELRRQREVLEEQSRQAVERVREEAEREKRNALALQNKVVELQTCLQELESEGRLQKREQAAALTAVRRALREEQQAELHRLRRHMEQEGQREVARLQQAVQQAEGETQALQAALAERGRSQEEGVARVEQLQRGWAMELGAECQRLQELLEHSGTTGSTVHLLHNPTVAQAVQTLRGLREQLYNLVSHLHRDLDSQRHAAQQLGREKERELRIQREQLALEKEQALDSLRERLIQDHIEELSSLQRAQLRESGGDVGGVAASLRRQLQDKDNELRDVQRNMARWKEQTAARLARKFEEELTAELERCKAELLKERRAPKARLDQQKKLQRLESEMRRLTTEYGDTEAMRSVSSPSLLSVDPPATPRPPDVATFKLLRHLQSRVRQLRAENTVHTCSPAHLGSARELAGSYLETIASSPERYQARSRPHNRTVQS